MKFLRSSKCSLKFGTQAKRNLLVNKIFPEYSRVVNYFIDQFWTQTPDKAALLAPIVNSVSSWLTHRFKKVAAREAIDLILSVKNKKDVKARNFKPQHRGKRMQISSTIAELQNPKNTNYFDHWLHLQSIGDGIILDLPIKLHKQYKSWAKKGRRLNSYILTTNYVQFVFEVETTPKKVSDGKVLGVDSGIKALATTSEGDKLGQDIGKIIDRIKRKEHGSKKQQSSRRALKQRMDEVAKKIVDGKSLIIVEALKKLNHRSKLRRRLSKNMRRSLGIWAYSYWLHRLKSTSENNRVNFIEVAPAYTSQRCSSCGHTQRENRTQGNFLCQSCGYTDDADVNAAKNILVRGFSGVLRLTTVPLTNLKTGITT